MEMRTLGKFLVFGIILILISMNSFVSSQDFKEVQKIINNRISCSELSEDQLEVLGDYYMEQMHPGELHEKMDNIMGGEGSLALRNVHINMGKSFYCGDQNAMSPSMVNMMMGRTNMQNYGMMGNYSSFFGFYGNIFIMLFWILIIILIMWIIIKLSKNNKKETSLEILKRRYAKGEINKKEFDKLKKDLM